MNHELPDLHRDALRRIDRPVALDPATAERLEEAVLAEFDAAGEADHDVARGPAAVILDLPTPESRTDDDRPGRGSTATHRRVIAAAAAAVLVIAGAIALVLRDTQPDVGLAVADSDQPETQMGDAAVAQIRAWCADELPPLRDALASASLRGADEDEDIANGAEEVLAALAAVSSSLFDEVESLADPVASRRLDEIGRINGEAAARRGRAGEETPTSLLALVDRMADELAVVSADADDCAVVP